MPRYSTWGATPDELRPAARLAASKKPAGRAQLLLASLGLDVSRRWTHEQVRCAVPLPRTGEQQKAIDLLRTLLP